MTNEDTFVQEEGMNAQSQSFDILGGAKMSKKCCEVKFDRQGATFWVNIWKHLYGPLAQPPFKLSFLNTL